MMIEALHGNGLLYAMKLLRGSELPHSWIRSIVFLKHLPPISNAELFDALAIWGDIVTAFQVIVPATGAWATTGVALFNSDAARIVNAAAAHEIIVTGQAIAVLPFQGIFGAIPSARPGPRLPERAASPRDWLRKLTQLNLRAEEIDPGNAKIAALTIEQTYAIVRYPPEQIIDWLKAKG
jgi:hypothetical protein